MLAPPTVAQISALMPFLEKFESPNFSPGKWQNPPEQFPWFRFDETVLQFVTALEDNGWITPDFDWTKWQGAARQYIEDPELIVSADAVTIQKLLMTHVRADRFCEGHLAGMFANGHITIMLRRLAEIRETMSLQSQQGGE